MAAVRNMQFGAIFLPGIVTPAAVAYSSLRAALGGERPIVLHELAVYDNDGPHDGYAIENEIASVLGAATKAGLGRFHVAGYSAGGAIAAAVAAEHAERIASLALMEPAWLGNTGVGKKEQRAFDAAIAASELAGPDAMREFVRLNSAEGVEPPPAPEGDPPVWMARRPAGIKAFGSAISSHDLDLDALRRLDCPVLYLLTGKSNPDLYVEREKRARALFADYTLTVFEHRHHFDPPHRAEPERLAEELQIFWAGAEAKLKAEPS